MMPLRSFKYLLLITLLGLSLTPRLQADGFPRQVTDAVGNVITLTAPPQRIVSQTLATDELLMALVAPSRIAALSYLADDPQYSNIADRNDLPPLTSGDPEHILSLQPDLILVASYSRAETLQLLQVSGAPVFQFSQFQQLSDIERNISVLGELVGEEQAAAQLQHALREALANIQAQVPKRETPPTVISFSEGFTAGKATLFDDLLNRLGAVNLAAKHGLQGHLRLNKEVLAVWQPEIILVLTAQAQHSAVRQQLLAHPAIASTPAARQHRIHFLDNRQVLAVSHYVANGFAALAAAIYGIALPAPF